MNRKTYLGGVLGTSMFFALILLGFLPKPLAEPAKKEPADALKTTEQHLVDTYGKLPLSFEANVGQTDDQAKFLSRGSGYTLFLTPRGEAVLVLRKAAPKRDPLKPAVSMPATLNYDAAGPPAVVRMKLVGGNASPQLEGLDQLSGKASYFIGNDPKKWRTNVPLYAEVRYREVYPGVDLVYYGNQRQLEHDFIVAPGANPRSITLDLAGAEKLSLDSQGALVLAVKDGELRLDKPSIYQEVDGVRREISGGYVLQNTHQVSFQVASYDATRSLVIDPSLVFSTFLGASNNDAGRAIAVDIAGNAYVTGETVSTNFPTVSAYNTAFGGGTLYGDAFVTKLNPTGSGLVYSTYLGGTGEDQGLGISVDSSGNAYVIGRTNSTNFPTTTTAFQTLFGGGDADAFVTKLNSAGTGLLYSTYLGGSGQDIGNSIAVDSIGNAYVTGQTSSGVSGTTSFPTTTGAFRPTYLGGSSDAFASKINPSLVGAASLVYSTYLWGGAGSDFSFGIAVDASFNAYLTGQTNTTGIATSGAFQTILGGSSDAVVAKLNPLGSALLYLTYLGGSGFDFGNGIAVDGSGNAYVTGQAGSSDFPTSIGAVQTTFGGGVDAFVTKVNPSGSGLVYSTFLGGSSNDAGTGIGVDGSGNAFVTGLTLSSNFPAGNAPSGACAGTCGTGASFDAFVTEVNSMGSRLVYSTYLGGSGFDEGTGIALDFLAAPDAYVVGFTGSSTDFPTTMGAVQTTFGGGSTDAFVAKISEAVVPPPPSVGKVTGGGTVDVTGGVANFGFIVQAQSSSGPIGGDLQYVNHASGAKIHSVTFSTFTLSGNTATFSGACTNNGAPCTFNVTVQDNDQPPGPDSFVISIDGGSPEGGTLSDGDIEIHNQ